MKLLLLCLSLSDSLNGFQYVVIYLRGPPFEFTRSEVLETSTVSTSDQTLDKMSSSYFGNTINSVGLVYMNGIFQKKFYF